MKYQNGSTDEEIDACMIEEAVKMWNCFEYECEAIMPDGTCLEGDCVNTFSNDG